MKKAIILFLIFFVSLLIYAGPNVPVPDSFFGIHMNKFLKGKDKPWPDLPFKTWRLWDTGICWPNIEPERGVYKFELIDKAVDYAQKHNVEPVINIGLCPRWAAARPNDRSGYGELLTASEPKDINDWKDYVRTLADRYKGKIKYWEIWNEPDIRMFFTGTTDKMVELVKAAYQILKAADPENMIISPPVTGYLTLIPWLDDFLKKGGKDYIDIIGTHFYVWSLIDTPEKSILTAKRIRAYAKKNGIPDIPVWDTECGFRKDNVTNSELEEGYIARLSVVQWYYGIERVIFYSLDNKYIIRMVADDYKTLNNIGVAFRETHRWLAGSRVTALRESRGDVWIAKLARANGSKGLMIWHSNDLMPDSKISFVIPDNWDYTSIVNLSGVVSKTGKKNTINIGVAPVLLYEDTFFK